MINRRSFLGMLASTAIPISIFPVAVSAAITRAPWQGLPQIYYVRQNGKSVAPTVFRNIQTAIDAIANDGVRNAVIDVGPGNYLMDGNAKDD